MLKKGLIERLELINSKAAITKLVQDFDDNGNDFKNLLKIIQEKEIESIDKASWLAREYANIKPEIATKYYSKIIEIVSSNCSDPVKRNLTGLLVDIGIPERYQSKVLDLSINILLDFKLAVAVHANALKLIKMLIKVHPDIKHEIDLITERHPYRNRVSFFCNL
jgi:hypothetical protein